MFARIGRREETHEIVASLDRSGLQSVRDEITALAMLRRLGVGCAVVARIGGRLVARRGVRRTVGVVGRTVPIFIRRGLRRSVRIIAITFLGRALGAV